MTKNILKKGLWYRVGKGDNIDFWEDPWVPNNPHVKPTPLHEETHSELGTVSLLMNSSSNWSQEIQRLFDRETVKNILKIPIANSLLEDKLVWNGNVNGAFSVKLAFLTEFWTEFSHNPWWKFLWSSKLHERMKIFLWKLVNGWFIYGFKSKSA